MASDDNQLGSFLRSRREKIDAASAGVADNTRRRVKGLRREELALLAELSPSYYTRLEQGRDRRASREILQALARVLRLDDTERSYRWSLAAPSLDLERWADLPAFIVDPRRDVLAGTALAARVNPAWSPGHNWDEIALQAVGGLRATAAARRGELDGFVADMRERSTSPSP